MGLHVVMLTGDNRITAEAIRGELGIEQAISDVLPTEKEANIRALAGEGVTGWPWWGMASTMRLR